MIGFILALAMQAAPAATTETSPAPWPDAERELGMIDGYSTDSDAKARTTLTAFANCVAEVSGPTAEQLLQRDFRTNGYRTGLTNLSRNNEGCARKVGLQGRMKMAQLAFAGALAEALLRERNGPLNVALVRAASGQSAPTYSFTDGIAMCVVRSAPDQVAALFATPVAGRDEAAAIKGLAMPAELCARAAKAKKPLSISPSGLRAMLATAAYRSVSATSGAA